MEIKMIRTHEGKKRREERRERQGAVFYERSTHTAYHGWIS